MANDLNKQEETYPWEQEPNEPQQIVKPIQNPTLFDEPEREKKPSVHAAGEQVGEAEKPKQEEPKQEAGESVGEAEKAALPEAKKKASAEEIQKYMNDKILGNFTQQELDVLQSTIASGTNKPEFRLFIQTCVNSGLNPFLNHIYPIVYSGKNGRKLTLQISVEGIMSLARKVKGFKGVDVQLVHENDEFQMKRVDGKMTVSVHEFGLPRGQVVGGYAVARLEGFADAIVVMEVGEVDEMKKGRNKDMWNTWFNDMFKKHILKRAAKEQYGIELTEEPMNSTDQPNELVGDIDNGGRKIEVEQGVHKSEEELKSDLWVKIYSAADEIAMNVDEVQNLIHSKFNKPREELTAQNLVALQKFVQFYKREEVQDAEFSEVNDNDDSDKVKAETKAEVETKDEYEEMFN